MSDLFFWIEIFILLYFLGSNSGYLLLNIVAWFSIRSHRSLAGRLDLQSPFKRFLKPVSLVVPAWNEEESIIDTIRSLQNQVYGDVEIIVVNDGSDDNTLEVVRDTFDMEAVPDVYRNRIDTAPVRRIYKSRQDPDIRLIDKENAGRFDAVNAGTNAARYPLVCTVDADSLLDERSVFRMAQPFHEDETTIASGGAVRVLNGCKTEDGRITEARLPQHIVPLFQVVEYLRAFQFGRMGWAVIRALLAIAGTWGMYRREAVEKVDGFRNTVAEDMEMTTRLQKTFREKDEAHRISFSPDAFCWTEVPEEIQELGNQRMRWQRGVGDALAMNAGLPFRTTAGPAGWLAFPFFLFFEFLGPVIELASILYFLYVLVMGYLSIPFLVGFLLFSIVFGMFLSFTAILQEERSYGVYRKQKGYTAWLLLAAVLEHFGYRQVLLYYRLKGMGQFVFTQRGGAYK